MARGVRDRLPRATATVVAPEQAVFDGLVVHVAPHPVPDARSVAGAALLRAALSAAGPHDLVLALVSGGGSALVEEPAAGLTLHDLSRATRALLASGAPIDAVNTIRQRLSTVKGGGLLRGCRAAVEVLVASDVPGDDPHLVASGPFSPPSGADALAIARRWLAPDALPPAAWAALGRASSAVRAVPHTVVARNADAVAAAARALTAAGYDVAVHGEPVEGEAADLGRVYAVRAAALGPGQALVLGGEPTVTLGSAPGRGGRSQELALAALVAGLPGDAVILAAGTDGVDGPTDAAGAVVHGGMPTVGLGEALARHDTYPALDRLSALVRTGPTGANAMDLHILLRAQA
jgi:glycerate 2-kinase